MAPAPAYRVDVAVLDDDDDFCRYVEDLLRDEGRYTVRTFQRPDDLFEGCRQRAPEIVLLDVKMGEFRAEKVLEQLLPRWPEVCVIIITGYPSLEDMRGMFKMKIFDYLIKPFSAFQLRQTLNKAIDAFNLDRSDPDRFRRRLGHRIRILRAEREWSLKDLADATEISISQISSIERGTHCPSVDSLLAICRVFHVRPSELLSAIDF
jgi:DNA-binding NtrC family response regulator